MRKGLQLQWSIVIGLLLGSFVNLYLYSQSVNANTAMNNRNVLMAALEPARHQTAWASMGNLSGNKRKEPVFIPLEQDERALMVEAVLDNEQAVSLILDTGATYTTISQDLALSLGYDLTHASRVRITTANGQVLLPKILLESITLNGYTAYNVEATVMPMPNNVPFSGLLGLNFVKRHRITIDPAARHLLIEPQKG